MSVRYYMYGWLGLPQRVLFFPLMKTLTCEPCPDFKQQRLFQGSITGLQTPTAISVSDQFCFQLFKFRSYIWASWWFDILQIKIISIFFGSSWVSTLYLGGFYCWSVFRSFLPFFFSQSNFSSFEFEAVILQKSFLQAFLCFQNMQMLIIDHILIKPAVVLELVANFFK